VAAHARRIAPERTVKKHPNRYGLTEAKGTIGSLGVDPMEQTGKRRTVTCYPSPEGINALPDKFRQYVHDLETLRQERRRADDRHVA
jgi:hypothetical protein